MFKLISLVDLIHNIDYEKINCIKNDISYIKDILSLHNYELVDLVSEGFDHNFNLVFCNSSHGVLLPSSQIQRKDEDSSNIMLCEIIHNRLTPNYHEMKMYYNLNHKDGVYSYYKDLYCIVDENGYISDVNIFGGVYYCSTPEKLDFFSLYAFLLVKNTNNV